MTLAQQAFSGIIWNFIEQLLKRGVGAFVSIFLARFLIPEDFALIAMMAIFLAIANTLMESGLNLALIRIQSPGEMEFNTAFYANIFLGFLSYLLLFFIAPIAASFYSNPQLVTLIRVTGIGVLINSLSIVQLTIFKIKLDFKTQLKASFPAGLISGIISVALAYYGFGVWALVSQMLASSLLNNCLLWSLSDWRPKKMFCWGIFRELFSFSYKFVLANFSNIIFTNIYVVVVSKFFASTIAGHFYFAEKIKDLVLTQIVNSIQNVSYPALSRLQSDDGKLVVGLKRTLSSSAYLLNPIFIYLILTCNSWFTYFLDQKWLLASNYLQIMSIEGLIYPLHLVNINILILKGRSDYILVLEILKKSCVLIGLFLGIHYGIYGVLTSQIICSVLAFLPNTFFSAKLLPYYLKDQLGDFFPAFLLAMISALTAKLVCSILDLNVIFDLLMKSFIYFSLYIILSDKLGLESFHFVKKLVSEKLKLV